MVGRASVPAFIPGSIPLVAQAFQPVQAQALRAVARSVILNFI
jgi:hypothetical protein